MAGMIRDLFPSQHSEDEDSHRNHLKMFIELCGVSKSQSSVDYAMLEYCIREDLKIEDVRV